MNERDKITKVAVGIIFNNNRVLICQRKKGTRYELFWEFPGGKVEKNESITDCLKRELREELSITISQVDKIETHTAFYDDGGWFEVYYCYITQYNGKPHNNVFEEIRWVTPQELLTMNTLHGNEPIIKKLAATASKKDL